MDNPSPPTPSPRRPALGFIFITLVLDVLGFSLLIPVAPSLIKHVTGEGIGGAAQMVGFLSATYAVMQFLFSPLLGVLSDRFGRRPVLLSALFGSGIDYFALALSGSLWMLFVTRALNGLTGATITVASAYIADTTPPEKRAGAFGLVGAAFGIGFVLGPLMGGYLGSIDIHLPFYAAGTLTLLNWLFGYFVLPESLPPEKRAPMRYGRANPIGAFAGLGKYPLVAGLAGAYFLFNISQYALHSTWVLYNEYRFSWTTRDTGISLAVVGIGAAIVQGGLARKIIPALGEPSSLLIGLFLGVVAYATYGFAPEGWVMYVGIAIGTFGGLSQPASQAMISKTVEANEQGATQGALTAITNVANIIGPLAGTALFSYFISDRAPVKVPGASFYFGALVSAIGWLIAFRTIKRWKIARSQQS